MDVDDILWTTLLYLEEQWKLADYCIKANKRELRDTDLSPAGIDTGLQLFVAILLRFE